ncbi:MAG TPA: hypothetical protein VGB52_08970 [Actinomycetota bacterium]|jgi:hypothetical protein
MKGRNTNVKRITLITVALSLALTACAGGKAVGSGDLVDIEETNRTEASPTVSKTASAKAAPTRSAPESQPPKQDLCPPNGEFTVRIKTLGDGFQWKQEGSKDDWAPTPFRVLQGCNVTFRNEDPDRKHSWFSGDNGSPDAGEGWKSPALATGKTWVMDTTKVPAGFYSCHDGEVPYIVCSAEIVPRQ